MTVRSGNPSDPNNQPYASVVWEYDHRGRVTHEARMVKDTLNTPDIWSDDLSLGTYHTYWSYNPDNSIKQIVYPNMETVNFGYLPQGTIDQVFSIQNGETSDLTQYYIQKTAYDEAGRVSERTLGNNLLQTKYDYFDWFEPNGQGRLSSIKTVRLSDNNILQDLSYMDVQAGPEEPGYDAVGNIRYIEDATSQQRQAYGYDALNRLISANVTGQGEGLYSAAYVYDPTTGNLSQKDGIAYSYDLQHPHAVKKLDGVDRYEYDANGSMTSRVVNGTTYTLTYDMENRLTAITGDSLSARYIYDGDGKRVLSVVGDTRTLYIGDYFEAQVGSTAQYPLEEPPTLTNYSMCHDNRCSRVFLPAIINATTPVLPLGMTQGNFGNTYYHTHAGTPQTGVKWLTYYSGGGARVAVREKSGSSDLISYLLQDHLGSTTRAVDSQGVVTARMLYKAWGETRVPSGSAPAMPTMRRYTGQYEAETGLYFYGARFYDPSLGRFAQADTFIPQPGNPISWDRYAYINNSPLNGTDTTGHCIDGISTYFCLIAAGAIVGALVSYGTQVAGNIAENGWSGEAFTNVDGASIAAAAVAGAVGTGVGLAGAAIAGTGLVATVATGAVGGMISGQASRATNNVLTGQDIGAGLGNVQDMLVDGALGGLTSYAGYEAGRLIQSVGRYGTNGGHHIHAKAAFKGNNNYNEDLALSVSQDYMNSKGWFHSPNMNTAQRRLFDNLADSGMPNSMTAHNRIAYQTLRAGRTSPVAAWYLVQRSARDLARQGITSPNRIPWN